MIFKECVTMKLLQFLLRFVQGQESKELCRLRCGFDDHLGRLLIAEDSIVWGKKMLCAEIARINKCFGRRAHVLHAV